MANQLEAETMSEENNNAELSEAGKAADGTKRPSKDAGGLGPMQAGPFAIGLVDEIVGEDGGRSLQ
jgi:hypothetical protein